MAYTVYIAGIATSAHDSLLAAKQAMHALRDREIGRGTDRCVNVERDDGRELSQAERDVLSGVAVPIGNW